MGQELLYEDEVLLALAAVSLLFEGAQSKDSDDGCSQARWVSLAPPEGFRLLNGVILYEQLVFELYTCDAFVKPDRRLKLENEATITRRRLVACLKQQPNIARPIVIHNEDRGAVRIPVQVTPILDTVQRLQRFHRFLRKSSGVELSFVVAVAKSVARIRSICGSRLPNQRVTSSSEDTSAEMHIEHNGVQARLHPHTNPVYQPVSVSVSSSTKLNFSRYNTLEAIAVGLAALAKGAFSSIDKGGVWQADALDDIIQAGKTLFNDTVLLTRQLAGQTGRDDLTESQLDEMLGQLDDQMELVQFNCRVISTSREVSQWRGLKRRQIVQLDESTFEQAITEFFLSSKTALVVAKGTVLALCDGDVRNAVEVAADHCLISHSHVSVSDVVGMVFRIFQGAAILHVFDESPRADLIPRPIDQIEVQAWSESEQCAYHDAIWSLLKDQGRLKRRKTAGKKHESEEHRAWQRVLLQELNMTREERLDAVNENPWTIAARQLPKGEPPRKRRISEAHEASEVDDDSLSSAGSSSASSFNEGHSLTKRNSGEPSAGKGAGPGSTVESGVAVVDSSVIDRESAEGKCATVAVPYETGVESIFSDEENRAPDALGVLPDQAKNVTSHRRLEEMSAKAAAGVGNGQSAKIPASISGEFRMGQRVRNRSAGGKNPLPGDAAEPADPVEPDNKRTKRNSPRE